MPPRVVVTGIGCISSVGHSLADLWQATLQGRSGVKPITLFDTSAYDVHIAAEIGDWDPTQFMEAKTARRCDRFTQFAVAAADAAVADAALSITPENADDVGVVIGSGIGGMITWESQYELLLGRGPGRLSPFLVPMLIVDMAAGMVSIRTGARGPNYAPVSACASSAHAIGDAFEIIRRGAARAIIAGGSEAAISATGLGGFCAARALSTYTDDPTGACRPFDSSRDGFVMGEGATILILEALDHAISRGAHIYGEVIGFGMSGDAFNMVAPEPSGASATRAMQAALNEAGLAPDEIDYINAHAPATQDGDYMESNAIRRLYPGDYTPKTNSTKPIHGHQLGATAATELALSLMTMREGIIPRTLNCRQLDERIEVDVVRGENLPARVDTVMSNSFGFGGHNAVLVARRYEG